MDTSGNLPVSESATRRNGRAKAQRRKRSKSQATTRPAAKGEREYAAAGTLTRTKSLLLAALRVWELKHRVNDDF